MKKTNSIRPADYLMVQHASFELGKTALLFSKDIPQKSPGFYNHWQNEVETYCQQNPYFPAPPQRCDNPLEGIKRLEAWFEGEYKSSVAKAAQSGEWSKPMPKSRMMTALGIDSIDTFNSYAERVGIEEINRKSHRIRLDGMNPKDREKIEKA